MRRCYLLLIGTLLSPLGFTPADDQPHSQSDSDPPVIDFDPDWTPRPVAGDVPWYMQETDVDWLDDRLRKMDTGWTWNATFRYAEQGLTPDPNLKPGDPAYQPVKTHRSFKGTAIRIGGRGEAGIIFDRNQCRWACAWTGDFLWHKDRRFGLLNTPQPAGEVVCSTRPEAGWSRSGGDWPEAPAATGPLPKDWAHFLGVYRHGDQSAVVYRVGQTRVIDVPQIEHQGDVDLLTRTLLISPHREVLKVLICETRGGKLEQTQVSDSQAITMTDDNGTTVIALIGETSECELHEAKPGRLELTIPQSQSPTLVKVGIIKDHELTPRVISAIRTSPHATVEGVLELTELEWPSGPWTVVTRGQVAADTAPLVVDTITVPYDNPSHALMFVSGVDFLPSGELAVSTVHGDIWLVSGVDEDLEEIVWKRFATGLYQPLGLKVVDGQIHVLERGQLTRLHDSNNDGTADYYESLNADWHVGRGEHSFDTCLETDLDGNWYFHSTGDPKTPTGGTVIKVTPDGSTSEVFCTGFRHPIGMGVLPDGRITGADQEGNWMPSTRIDIYRKDGFYGDMRAHHRDEPPEIYDGPLCWLPRQLDGSAGGQVSVPDGLWGPLSGRTLHLSYGKCRMMLLMMQRMGEVEQAGAIDLGLQFLSGIQRGRFRPQDGHLYVVGMDGWQTAAVVDGCLQRVRYTGQPFRIPINLNVESEGLRLTFSDPLDRRLAADPERYHIEQWNYLWQAEYGSKRWSVTHPDQEGQDDMPIESVSVSDDRREVFLKVPNLQPVMQMQIDYRLADENGTPVEGVIYNTIHSIGE